MSQRENPRLDWFGDPSPNPGPEAAFRLGVPYMVLDEHGQTHIARNRVELDAIP